MIVKRGMGVKETLPPIDALKIGELYDLMIRFLDLDSSKSKQILSANQYWLSALKSTYHFSYVNQDNSFRWHFY